MTKHILADVDQRMDRTLETLRAEFTKIRTGRAHTSLLDHVLVDYYGTAVPIQQVANVSVEDSRTLMVTPWERSMVAKVEKAILTSDLGLNPATAGTVIRVPLPPLTEERRRDLVRIVRQEAEQAKVAVRNVRRDANHQLKQMVKEKAISEDEERGAEERVQKRTDEHVARIDAMLGEKEKELMEV